MLYIYIIYTYACVKDTGKDEGVTEPCAVSREDVGSLVFKRKKISKVNNFVVN